MNLEQAVSIAPFMKSFYDEDISVYVLSKDTVEVGINHENLDLKVQKGDPSSKFENTGYDVKFSREEEACGTGFS